MSTGSAALRFSVGKAASVAWPRLKLATGSRVPPRQGKPKDPELDGHSAFILRLIDEKPDVTLDEIAARLAGERSVVAVRTAVWKFLHRCGMTHKRPRKQTSRSAPI
jgi:transposase